MPLLIRIWATKRLLIRNGPKSLTSRGVLELLLECWSSLTDQSLLEQGGDFSYRRDRFYLFNDLWGLGMMELRFYREPPVTVVAAPGYDGNQVTQFNGLERRGGDVYVLIGGERPITQQSEIQAGYLVGDDFFSRAQGQAPLNFAQSSHDDGHAEIILGVCWPSEGIGG